MATYSDSKKAEALALLDANGGNVSRTAKQLKIPRSTLQSWANDEHISDDVPEIRQVKKEAISDMLEEAMRTLIGVVGKKAHGASLFEVSGALKTVGDMYRLLNNEPTSIEKIVGEYSTDERRQRITELLNAARDRGASSSVGDGEFYQ